MVKRALFLIVISISILFACNVFNRTDKDPVITIGDRMIIGEQLREEIQEMIHEMGITEHEVKAHMRPIINTIVERALIMRYGEEEGITFSDHELDSAIGDIRRDYPEDVFREVLLKKYIDPDEWKEEVREELLLKKIVKSASAEIPPVTFNETKAYFESHRDEFKRPPMVQLRQVVTATKKEATSILERVKKGGSLEQEAREHSIAPEAENGGMLGWIAKGELAESLDDIIFSLSKDEISSVVPSPHGFHIFQVLATRADGLKELPEVMEEIEKKLLLQKRESFYRKWISQLRARYPVTIGEEIYTHWSLEG